MLFSQQAAYYKPPLRPGDKGYIPIEELPIVEQEEEPEAEPTPAPEAILIPELNSDKGKEPLLAPDEEESTGERAPLLSTQSEPSTSATFPRPVEHKNPDDVNIISFLTFSFINTLLNLKGDYKRRSKMQLSDLGDIALADKAPVLSKQFQELWMLERQEAVPKVGKILRKLFKRQFMLSGVLRFLYDILLFVPVLGLYYMINYAGHDDFEQWGGFLCAAVVFISGLAGSFLQHVYLYRTYRMGQNVRACIVTAVYRKCFKLSNLALYQVIAQFSTFFLIMQFPIGIIVNHMSVDPVALADG